MRLEIIMLILQMRKEAQRGEWLVQGLVRGDRA